MLKFFKRMERTRNFLLLLFAVVMVISLIVFYAPTGDIQENLTRSGETAATVGSEEITVGELVTQQQNMQQPLPANFLLNGMIRQRLLRIEAKRLGLSASDAEVAETIRDIFNSPDGTPFDQARYEENAVRQAGSVTAFEQGIRDQLSAQKVQAFVTSGVTVSEEEVLNNYKRLNTKFNLTYVPISTSDIAENIEPGDDELKSYFEKNKKNYYIDSPQKKIRYIFLNTSKVGEKLSVSDENLKAEYDKLPEERKQAGVEVQEIVLRVPNPEQDEQVLAKANQIAEDLMKDGGTVSEEKFAQVAKGQSERPVTAQNGGKVAGLVRPAVDPTKQDDPYQRVLNMKEGEITEPLKYGSNYYVLRRGQAPLKTFEDAKKELEVSLRNRKAYTINAELAGKVAEALKKEKDVKKVAEQFASQANMSVDNMIRETSYVKPGDEVENIGVSQDFEQGIASLEKQNDVGDKIPIPNGFAIPMLVDKKAPRDAMFDEVKEQVAEAYKADQARNRIEQIAKAIADNAASAGDLSSAATGQKLKALEAKDFVLGSPLGEGPSATTNEALEDAIFNLKKGEVTKPIKIGDNWYVVGVNEREEADIDDFAKEREQMVQQLLTQKQNRIFSDYLGAVRQEMETKGKIKIFKDAIAKIDSQTQPAGPQMPQFPQQQQQEIPIPPPPGN
ncbi:MAG: peptidyl-prolyl cis-trans isomerase [Acidobacteriota bacterium]|nr:peptidyl-prolyl cis-trans isomerase [Acidobacteriota bacterium]